MIKLSMILCVLSSCIFLNNDLPAYQAEIEYIPDRDYFETALEEINQARESIKVYMFVIAARPDQPGSKVMRLLDALVAAKDRGVDVTVHVDQNVPFGQDPFDGGVEGKNENAYAYLKGQGVKIFVDNPYSYAHAKAVIIDGQTAIVGSSNWSASAFEQNNETTRSSARKNTRKNF